MSSGKKVDSLPISSWFSNAVVFLSVLLASSFSQASGHLFDSSEMLRIQLRAPFNDLFNHRNEQMIADAPAYVVQGELRFKDAKKGSTKIPVQVSLRGNSSQKVSECPFPKLSLKLNPKDALGTVFEGEKEIHIATHCGSAGGRSAWLGRNWDGTSPYREFIVYQILKELGIPAYRARIATATYVESTTQQAIAENKEAFFLETLSSLKKRYQSSVEIHSVSDLPQKTAKPGEAPTHLYSFSSVEENSQRISMQDVAKIYLFEALVQNYDWFLKVGRNDDVSRNLWNIKMIEVQGGQWMAVPYDFDLSAVVTGGGAGTGAYDWAKARIPFDQRTQAYDEFLRHKDNLYRLVDQYLPEDLEGRAGFKIRMDQFFEEFGPHKQFNSNSGY